MPGFSGKTLSDFCPSAERGDHGIDFRGLHTFLFLLTPLGGGDPSRTSTIWPPSRFLLTPQRRGDPTTTGRPSTPTGNFYSRPRAGAIAALLVGVLTMLQFLLTPPGGGDPRSGADLRAGDDFYSRPRAGAISLLLPRLTGTIAFLLTPPGGGDRQGLADGCGGGPISTHAPGRGRSNWNSVVNAIRKVFLLTPPGGGDRDASASENQGPYFYSRPRAGAIFPSFS